LVRCEVEHLKANGEVHNFEVAWIRPPGYAYRRGYGWGPAAVGLSVLGAAAVGAAAAGSYGYADPCLRQQQVYDVYGKQTVRVC
jgi:hypothetical protein